MPRGVSLCISSSRLRSFFLVEGSVFEHGVDDVAAAPGEADDGGVVFLAFGAFPLVVGLGERVVARGYPGGPEERVLEFFVA